MLTSITVNGALEDIITKAPFTVIEVNNKNYEDALYALRLGNLKVSEEHLKSFMVEIHANKSHVDNKDESSSNLAEDVVAKTDVKTEERIAQDLAEVKNPAVDQKVTDNAITTEEDVIRNKKLELMLNKANFLLGDIYFINNNLSDSLIYFANSYKNTQDVDLTLLNLSRMIEVFEAQNKTDELCLSVSRLEVFLSRLKNNQLKHTSHAAYDAFVVEKKEKHKCAA